MNKEKESANEKIANGAVWKGKIKGHNAFVFKGPLYDKTDVGYNGYVRYKKRPVIEPSYMGILDYVPVWGGITYADEDENGIIYGFDTGHINQEKLPVRDVEWIKKQIGIMVSGIDRAKKVEKKYLKCLTNKGKLKHIQFVAGKDTKLQDLGFGAWLNFLSGKV